METILRGLVQTILLLLVFLPLLLLLLLLTLLLMLLWVWDFERLLISGSPCIRKVREETFLLNTLLGFSKREAQVLPHYSDGGVVLIVCTLSGVGMM